jgi:uncharacterized protein YciI
MSPAFDFLLTLRPGRPDFIATMTPEEHATMQRHRAYADRLYEQGKIIFGGVATDGSIGILVLRVESEEEARQIRKADPAVIAGIGDTEIHPFRVGMLAGSGDRRPPVSEK